MSPMTLFPFLFMIGFFIRSKSKKAGAIYDLIWSAGILIYALSAIAAGDQLMLFNLELPNAVIVLIILAIMASEIVTLVGVCKEKSPEEQRLAMDSEPLPEGVEPIEDDGVATITLEREAKFTGSGVMVPVIFNEKDYGTLGNGKTITLHTHQKHNRISLTYGKEPPVIEFDAENGVEYVIYATVGVAAATMTIREN